MIARKSFLREEIQEWILEIRKKGKEGLKKETNFIYEVLKSGKDFSPKSIFPPEKIAGNMEENYERSIFGEERELPQKTGYPSRLILKSLKFFSPVQVAIFVLRYIDNRPQENVAGLLNCSHQYISQQEKRIRAILGKNGKFILEENEKNI